MCSINNPTNIVKNPSPKTAQEAIFVVWNYARLKPNWGLRVKTCTQRVDMDTPNRTALRQHAKLVNPLLMRKRLSVLVAKVPQRRYFIFSLLVPGMKANMKRNMVMKTQNMEGQEVAFYLVLTPAKMEQEEIHPAYVSYNPIYRNREKQSKAYIFLGVVREVYSLFPFCSSGFEYSGGGSIQQAGRVSTNSSPITTKACISKMQTMMGPIRPPMPKAPWVSSSQNYESSLGLVIRMQTFTSTSKTTYPIAAATIQNPYRKSDSDQEKRAELMPTRMDAPMRIP